ncbi:MAG: radical SAM protein [Planctomycetota bacterium]
MVSRLPFVLHGLQRFKARRPDAVVILGGPGPSGVASRIVASMPWIDIVCRGEGEETLVELLRALKQGRDLKEVRGITFRDDNNEVCQTQPRPRQKNIDGIAPPAYERVAFSDYTNIPIITGRGCPYQCAFCDVGPLWGNKTYFRSVDRVAGELDLLKSRFGVTTVNIADDTFDLNRKRAEALLSAVGDLGLNWSCLARVDLMDEDLLGRMVRAGCRNLFLGIESGSDAVLKKINKRFTIKEATLKVEMASRYMDKVITSFIWGFPFETMRDFKETLLAITFMWHLGAMAGLKLLSPMPLSSLGIEYKGRLAFSEELCSVFASFGNVKSGRIGIPEELVKMIIEYPEVFAGFYHIETDGLSEKAEYLDAFSRKKGITLMA